MHRPDPLTMTFWPGTDPPTIIMSTQIHDDRENLIKVTAEVDCLVEM